MKTNEMPLNQRAVWKALQAHAGDIHGKHLRQLITTVPQTLSSDVTAS